MAKHIVVVYGSLMQGLHNHMRLRRGLVSDQAKYLGDDVINVPYKMVDLGSFPGIIPNDEDENASNENIFVEVYECNDHINEDIEDLEGYNQSSPEKGLYRKESVSTKYGSGSIYVFNNDDFGGISEVAVEPNPETNIINWREFCTKQY